MWMSCSREEGKTCIQLGSNWTSLFSILPSLYIFSSSFFLLTLISVTHQRTTFPAPFSWKRFPDFRWRIIICTSFFLLLKLNLTLSPFTASTQNPSITTHPKSPFITRHQKFLIYACSGYIFSGLNSYLSSLSFSTSSLEQNQDFFSLFIYSFSFASFHPPQL